MMWLLAPPKTASTHTLEDSREIPVYKCVPDDDKLPMRGMWGAMDCQSTPFPFSKSSLSSLSLVSIPLYLPAVIPSFLLLPPPYVYILSFSKPSFSLLSLVSIPLYLPAVIFSPPPPLPPPYVYILSFSKSSFSFLSLVSIPLYLPAVIPSFPLLPAPYIYILYFFLASCCCIRFCFLTHFPVGCCCGSGR